MGNLVQEELSYEEKLARYEYEQEDYKRLKYEPLPEKFHDAFYPPCKWKGKK